MRLSRFARLQPVSQENFRSEKLTRWLTANGKDYDVIVFHSFDLCQYRQSVANQATILIPWDAFSMAAMRGTLVRTPLSRRLGSLWRWIAYLRFEETEYRKFSVVSPVSSLDGDWLSALDGRIRIAPILVAIDPQVWDSPAVAARDAAPHVHFSGSLEIPEVAAESEAALREVLPALAAESPDAFVSILHRGLPNRIRALADDFPALRIVEHPKDYLDFVRDVDVFVYPQRSGGGLQTKVQEACALGLPVVGRSETLDVFELEHGRSAMICDNDRDFVEAIIGLCRDPALRGQLGSEGRRLVRDRFRPANVSATWHRVLQQGLAIGESGR
jgi:glycosyltransferase involved in cell wall biosynthesis